jgi:acetyl-CoA carboxylase carboxyl transferase subunit beta
MSWLSEIVRPKIRAFVAKKPDIPDNLWHKCGNCGEMIFHRDYAGNANVCHHCGFHGKLPLKRRLELLFDGEEYTRIELPKVPVDPLKFKDRKRYSDRHKDAQTTTKEQDACIVAHGLIGGQNVVVAAFNFEFMGGSMGTAVGEALYAGARLAVLQKAAYIVIPSSGGARMQEGILSLMQMARTTIGVQRVREAGLPYIVVLTNPTTGGVTASFAMLGDVTLAEPGAIIGFAGARVIEETIREKLPPGFQRSEYLLEHGMIDRIVTRKELAAELGKIAQLLMNKKNRGLSSGTQAATPQLFLSTAKKA